MSSARRADRQLLVTTEGGKLLQVDCVTGKYRVLFSHPRGESIFGVATAGERVYLAGATFVACTRLADGACEPQVIRVPFRMPLQGEPRRWMRRLWLRLGAHERVLRYEKPALHQMNVYASSVYIAATSWNEVWQLDLDLNLTRRIALQPRVLDYYHLNNVFCDGGHYYVCLNRYAGQRGPGGYAKFDLDWNEVERRMLGWEAHAFSLIDGHTVQLCCVSPDSESPAGQWRTPGLMVDEDMVSEYDPRAYFCKDFSMNDDFIYIVGGSVAARADRDRGAGVIFVLNRSYELIRRHEIRGLGGFNGCRLLETDYSRGEAPFARAPESRAPIMQESLVGIA